MMLSRFPLPSVAEQCQSIGDTYASVGVGGLVNTAVSRPIHEFRGGLSTLEVRKRGPHDRGMMCLWTGTAAAETSQPSHYAHEVGDLTGPTIPPGSPAGVLGWLLHELFASVILTVGATVTRLADVASAVVSLAEHVGSTPGYPLASPRTHRAPRP